MLRLAQVLYIDPQDIQANFDLFLFGDPSKLQFMIYSIQPPNSFWRYVYSAWTEWKPFADLALRYSSVFLTETLIEHIFSQQLYIHHQRMTHISCSVMKSRLQMHRTVKPLMTSHKIKLTHYSLKSTLFDFFLCILFYFCQNF